MKAQTSPSSSIIIVLTDGKLEVYPYELSVREVRRLRSPLQPVSMVQTVVVLILLLLLLPRLRKRGALEPESTAWGSWTLTPNRWSYRATLWVEALVGGTADLERVTDPVDADICSAAGM